MTDLADRWLAQDQDGARDRHEARLLEPSRAVRAWILERWLEGGATSDALSGFAQLGRVLAAEQVSCASALGAVSSFAKLVPASDPSALEAARSALGDAFVEARLEHERRQARSRFGQCWLEISPGLGAVAAAPPGDDPEWLQEWADGVARELLRRKIRRAHVRVAEPALAALESALTLVGIHVETMGASAPSPSRWRRLLGF